VIDKVPSSEAGARMRATYVKLCLSVLASPLLFAEEVAYVTFPPELMFYDQVRDEFGLAVVTGTGQSPVTIGVRGDLVGVFCAM
jgi:hypothetical protein